MVDDVVMAPDDFFNGLLDGNSALDFAGLLALRSVLAAPTGGAHAVFARRTPPGATPISRLKARAKAASER